MGLQILGVQNIFKYSVIGEKKILIIKCTILENKFVKSLLTLLQIIVWKYDFIDKLAIASTNEWYTWVLPRYI